jgi:cardiolipin synthase
MHKEKEHNISGDKNTPFAELVHSGEDYYLRLLNIITNAQNEIHLQTYIFENDSTGLEIAEALKKAANRKVSVYVLVDGYGSAKLSDSFFEELISQGIHIRFFSPWHSKNNFYIGRRLHHKIIVVDGKVAIIGGINIANKYRGSSTEQPWLDYAVQIEGTSIAEPLELLCKNIYLKKSRTKINNTIIPLIQWNGTSVKILCNDWLKRKNEIHEAYINTLRKADKEVILVASYFLPGRRLSNALKKAARRGVKVKIILSGISDLPIVMWATQYLYASLLNQGIELFEWKKSVLHGKLMVIDNEWSTIGSFNLNHLSSFGSIEMNAEINSQKFSEKLYTHLMGIIEQSEKITVETLKIRNGVFTRLKSWFAYRLVRIALIIVTYIPYNRFFK